MSNNAAATIPNNKPSVLGAMASKLQCDPKQLMGMLKKTVFSNCKTDEEFMSMCVVCNQYGLNPMLKEIYAFPTKNGGVMPMVSVDGWTRIMNKHPAFDGISLQENEGSCTCTIWRKDRKHPTVVTEYLEECLRKTEPWTKWPKRMLRHKATIQCARLAFGFTGIYEKDECERYDSTIMAGEEDSATEKPVKPSKSSEKLRAILAPTPQNEVTVEQAETPDPVPVETEPVVTAEPMYEDDDLPL